MTSEPAHRMSPQRGPVHAVTRLLFLQLLAVIAIAATITAVAAVIGPDNNDTVRAAAPSPDSSRTPGPTGSPTTPPPTTSSASETPSVSTSPETTSGAPTVVKVDVLNQSADTGSAGDVADRLREAGWEIGRVDDFHGNVSTTTVYWLDPTQRRQARQIARFLGGVRVQEGFDTLVSGRVSVVLVDKL